MQALYAGSRGLPGGFTLWDLLVEQRGVRHPHRRGRPGLTVEQILAWADAFRAKTGKWPTVLCSPQEIEGSGGERWMGIDRALRAGQCGLTGGSSLAKLLAEHRGVPDGRTRPRLTVEQVLAWADAFHARTGRWPTSRSPAQEIPGMDGEKWVNVDEALRSGLRGLPGGSSLAKLLARHRRVPRWAARAKARTA